MSWLYIPAVQNSAQPIALTGSRKLLKLLGHLTVAPIAPLNDKDAIQVLDLLAGDPQTYGQLLAGLLNAAGIGSADEAVGLWKELRTKYDSKQVQKLRALTRSFKDLGEATELDWKILGGDFSQQIVPAASVTLGLTTTAQAAAELEALASLPELPIGVPAPAADKSVMRIGLDGKLTVEGKLGFSAGVMAGGTNGSAAGGAAVDFFFLENRQQSFGIAAAARLGALVRGAGATVSPFRAADLSALFSGTELACVRITADSTLKFDAQIELGKTFDVGGTIKVKAGYTVAATAQEKGRFDYLLASRIVGGEPVIAIHIKRNSDSERTRSVSFGLELDPRGLSQVLCPLIEDHLAEADAALKEFRNLLPGSDFMVKLLEEVIDAELAQSPNRDDFKLAVGLRGGSPAKVLRDRIVGAIETATESWSMHIDTAATAIAREVTGGLRWLGPQVPDLQADLERAIKAALEAKRAELRKSIGSKIIDSAAYAALAEKLNRAGAAIPAALDQAQARLDQATKAVTELLDRLQRTISQARSLTAAAAEKKATLNLLAKRNELKQEGLDLRFDLYPSRPGAQEALQAILTGEMGNVMELIAHHGQQPASAPIIGLAGGYDIYESLKQSTGGELVVFDFNFGTASVIAADVKWAVDLAGNISALSHAEFTKTDRRLRERQIVAFVEANEMLFARYRSTINLGLTVSHEDESLEAREAEEFLAGLVDRGLLAPSAVVNAKAALAARGDKKASKGRLDVGITLTGEQLANLLARVEPMRTAVQDVGGNAANNLPKTTDEAPGCAWVLDRVSETVASVLAQQHPDKVLIARLRLLVDAHGIKGGLAGGIRAMTPQMVQTCWGREWITNTAYTFGDEHLRDLSVLEYRRHGAMALYEIACHLKALTETKAAEGIPNWTRDTLKAQQHRIAQLLSLWWLWGGAMESIRPFVSDRMRALTVALVESLMELTRAQDGTRPLLWASLSLPDGNGKLVPRLLTQKVIGQS